MKYIFFWFAELLRKLTDYRNNLYDKGYFKSFRSKNYTICVGNLRVGGTGKTPHIEYLIRLLSNTYNIAVVSRGYRRKRSGLVWADANSQVADLGDEPLQIYRKYGCNIKVCVCKNRKLALETIENRSPNTNLILLDDAFQHRKVRPHLNLLLTSYAKPFFKDAIFPAGMLRESTYNGRRADAVIVTKCPKSLNQIEKKYFKEHLKPYLKPQTPIFFSRYKYEEPRPLFENTSCPKHKNIILITGIAQVDALLEHLDNANFSIQKHFKFRDHTNYNLAKLERIKIYYAQSNLPLYILTTEKDAVKLLEFRSEPNFKTLPLFYLPISVYFENPNFENFLKTKLPS